MTTTSLLLGTGILGCSIVSGVLFAFSVFVMPALSRLPVAQGAAAMQAINVAALTPLVMLVLFGTAAVCLAIAVGAVRALGFPGAWLPLLGSLLYLVGVVGVTALANVPRNNALAALDPQSTGAAAYWGTYLREWTTWNGVRTLASGLAAIALIASR